MKNPLEEYLTEKTAFGPEAAGSFGGAIAHGLRDSLSGKSIGRAMGGGALQGGVGLAGLAAQKVVDAITKAHDFKQMLAYDQELASLHEEEPHLVNQMFSTLRTMNPGFTKDPVIASHYVKVMVQSPDTAAGMAQSALDFRDKLRPAVPLGQMMMSGAGARGGAKRGR